DWCVTRFGAAPLDERPLPPIAHAFTHFDLDIEPRAVRIATAAPRIADGDRLRWHEPGADDGVGLPAPIATLLRTLYSPAEQHGSVPSEPIEEQQSARRGWRLARRPASRP